MGERRNSSEGTSGDAGGSPRIAAACREHFSDLTCVISSCTSGRSYNDLKNVLTRPGSEKPTELTRVKRSH